MDELVKEYYLEKDCNCAETVLRVLNDRYHLNIADPRVVSGFGGGCGCGMLCGALAGAISALGPMYVATTAHAEPGFRENCGKLCRAFEAALGDTQCAELKPKYFREGTRCSEVVETAVKLFAELAQENGKA